MSGRGEGKKLWPSFPPRIPKSAILVSHSGPRDDEVPLTTLTPQKERLDESCLKAKPTPLRSLVLHVVLALMVNPHIVI